MIYDYGLSFVIPAFNEEKRIGNAVSSIVEEMRRCNWVKYEIIVVDHNSTDDTVNVAPKAGARVISEYRGGILQARVTGFCHAFYSHLVGMDADCVVPYGWLTAVIPYLRRDKFAAVWGPVRYYDGSDMLNIWAKISYKTAKTASKILHPTLRGGNYVLRHDVFDQTGMGTKVSFLPISFYGEDTLMAAHVKKYGKIVAEDRMWMYSSARRFKGQGVLKTTGLYALNYLAVSFFGKSATSRYQTFW